MFAYPSPNSAVADFSKFTFTLFENRKFSFCDAKLDPRTDLQSWPRSRQDKPWRQISRLEVNPSFLASDLALWLQDLIKITTIITLESYHSHTHTHNRWTALLGH